MFTAIAAMCVIAVVCAVTWPSVPARHKNVRRPLQCRLQRHVVTIVHVAGDRDYAFGRGPGLTEDVFLHRSQISDQGEFRQGDRFSCTVVRRPKGLQGRALRRVG